MVAAAPSNRLACLWWRLPPWWLAGGGGDPVAAPAPAPVSVAAGFDTTLTALGTPSVVTATNATSTAYDLVAAVGDTWRINFDTNGNAYGVTVVQTQYGLTDTTGTFTSSTTGNYTTYTLSGTAGKLVVDNRTKAIAGNMTLGAKSSSVSGTGYAAPALDKLAGTYNFVVASHNLSNGLSPALDAGQFTISAGGTSMAVCTGGLINAAATACTPVLANSSTTPERGIIATTTNGTIRFSIIEPGTTNTINTFVEASVHVGDRGPVILGDSYDNPTSGGVAQTGAVYAAKAVATAGTEFNGNWACTNSDGTTGPTVVVSGTTVTVTDPTSTPTVMNLTAFYDKIGTGLSLPGFLSVGTSLTNSTTVLALSSSLVVVEDAGDFANTLLVCRAD